MTQTAKRQHYVAQCYLRGFTTEKRETDKFIWVYEKISGRDPRLRSVKSVAYEEFYYAQEDEDGNFIPDLLEKSFKDVEDAIPQIIDKIENSRTEDKCNLTGEEAGALAFFVALSFHRVPSFRDSVKELYEWGAGQVANHVIRDMRTKNEIPDKIEALIDEEKIRLEVKDWVSLQPMAKMAGEMAQVLLRKPRQHLVAHESTSFMTSDNPVTFMPVVEDSQMAHLIGPMHPLSEIRMPLNRNVAVIYTPLPKDSFKDREKFHSVYTQLTKQQTKSFNKSTTHAAKRFVFSDKHSKSIIRLVKNSIGTEQRLTRIPRTLSLPTR